MTTTTTSLNPMQNICIYNDADGDDDDEDEGRKNNVQQFVN